MNIITFKKRDQSYPDQIITVTGPLESFLQCIFKDSGIDPAFLYLISTFMANTDLKLAISICKNFENDNIFDLERYELTSS